MLARLINNFLFRAQNQVTRLRLLKELVLPQPQKAPKLIALVMFEVFVRRYLQLFYFANRVLYTMGDPIFPNFKVLHVLTLKIENSVRTVYLEREFELLFEIKLVNYFYLLEVDHPFWRLFIFKGLLI